MKFFLPLIALFFLINGILLAQGSTVDSPSSIPDRIILTWAGDPATTQAVTWRTDVSVENAWAEIAIATDAPQFVKKAEKVVATTEELKTDDHTAHFHSVEFKSLKPNTLYAYRVGNGTHFSEWFQFKTAAKGVEPFTFMYFGDAQNEVKSLWSRCIRQGYSTDDNIDFLLHAGDLINRANSDSEWGEWFYSGGWIYGMHSNILTPGNHEYYRDGEDRNLSIHWKPTFTLPTNGPENFKESVYYIDYQGTRFISLNTTPIFGNEDLANQQVKWLETILKNNPNNWTIVTQHHPVYSTAGTRDNPEVRAAFQPLFEKYKVDLVLQGHDHTYGRGFNVAYGETHKDKGPVYVVSVSGPKMYSLSFGDWMERAASNTQLYQIITVEKEKIHYEAYTVTGQLYDAFELKRKGNGLNKFKDLAPKEVPEALDISYRNGDNMSKEEKEAYQKRFEAYKARKKK